MLTWCPNCKAWVKPDEKGITSCRSAAGPDQCPNCEKLLPDVRIKREADTIWRARG